MTSVHGRVALAILVGIGDAGGTAAAQVRPPSTQAQAREVIVTGRASGTFEVNLTPRETAFPSTERPLSRLAIEKRFHGDLEATSRGEMLAVNTALDGSAGYVAMEQVTGTLDGRRGTFALQHSGTMTRGAPELAVTVVPDSGTEELTGLAGRMTIRIEGGTHFYQFDYTIAAPP